jgi:fibronectin-binding autotransporter adhesin
VNVVQSGSLNRNAIYDSSATSVQLAELNINATGSAGTFTFTQQSGDLKATKENIGLGAASGTSGATAQFIQNGGSHTVDTLNLAYTDYHQARANASYKLNAGTLTVNTENIGYGGTATFTQDGGTHNVTGSLNIGTSQNYYEDDYGFGSGSYILNAGNLTASSENIGINGSSGSFTQNGGTHTVGSLKLGEGFPGNHTYEWGYGSYTLNGGTFNVGSISRGYYGSSALYINGGTLNLTGSSISVGDFVLGDKVGSNASFTLAAGKTMNVVSVAKIGGNGIGHFIQNGGTHTAKSLQIKTGSSYALNAGSLNVNQLENSGQLTIAVGSSVIGEGTGGGLDYLGYYQPYVESTFTQTAGVTQVDGLLRIDSVVIEGGTLQGNGTINAPVTVNGGTLGAGNSIGALTIDGTLTLNGGTLLTEIGGTANGTYDVLTVTGDVNLVGGTMSFSFGDGFAAQAGNEWEFLKGNVIGSLENMIFNFSSIPQGLNYVVSKTATGLKLSAVQNQAPPVPVPAAAWLMGTSLIGLGAIKRRKKAA